MRPACACLTLLLLAACTSDGPAPAGGGTGGASGGGSTATGVRDTLTRDVFPFSAPPARFATSQRGTVDVRLEPFEGGTAMWIGGDGLAGKRIDWVQEGSSLYCSDGPDRRVEFLRYGARAGTSWESSGRTIRFDGWERVQTPAGTFDAVRISSTLAVKPYNEVETWWFAPDVGLVQMRVDKSELYSMEMKRLQ